MKLILVFAVALAFLGIDKAYPQDRACLTLRINPTKVQEQKISDLADSVYFRCLKMPSDMFFSEIRKIIIKESRIYILDISQVGQAKIFCFDISGDFQYVIDKQGKGPGEYTYIYDFSLSESSIVLAVFPKGLMYYDKTTGKFKKTITVPEDASLQIIEMLNNHTIVMSAGRYQRNTSHHQLKIYDIEQKKYVFEGIPFENPALMIGATYRRLFFYNNMLSYLPMYCQTVYRVSMGNRNFTLTPSFKLDFGKYWIDEDLLANSYEEREHFFKNGQKYIHTAEVFESDFSIYVHYSFRGEQYIYLYDKQTRKHLNISRFTDNGIGWINKPVATYKNWVVNIISPVSLEEHEITPNDDLNKQIAMTDDIGRPILVFARFRIK